MRVAVKLTLALTAGIFVVMTAYALVQLRSEVTLFEADVKKSSRLGRSLRAAVEQVWRSEGEARARALVEEADDENSGLGIRIVRVDDLRMDAARPLLDGAALAALAEGREVRVMQETSDGDTVRHTLLPLGIGEESMALELFASLRDEMTFIRTSRMALALATLGVTAVCGVIVMAFASMLVSRPIDQLRDQARRIGMGDLSHRLSLRQRDELGALAADLNAMCDLMAENRQRLAEETDARLAALEQLRHTDRLATVGRLASAVAHQLGTPLSVVSMRAKMIATQATAADAVVANARVIAEQADRMADAIRRLLDFSRRRSIAHVRCNLTDVVTRTLELIAPVAHRRRLQVERVLPAEPVDVEADEPQLQQAIANIALNAFQAMATGGRMRVRVGRQVSAREGQGTPSEHAFVEIEDDGPGIDPEGIAKLFEPFFTTKPAGEGTGLGLPVAEGIVRDHGGWIGVESEPGRGARFTIFLVLADAVGASVEDVS